MAALKKHARYAGVKTCRCCGAEYGKKPKASWEAWQNSTTCSQKCALKVAQQKRLEPSIEERFWSKVDRSPGHGPEGCCWVWSGHRLSFGYGVFRRDGKIRKAHRVSFELSCGSIPEGQNVLHRCDNASCVRPDHLFLGSHKQNMADMVAKGRARAPKGESSPRAKLTEADALAIRADARVQKTIAAEYGVSQSAVMLIKTGRNWKHLWQAGVAAE